MRIPTKSNNIFLLFMFCLFFSSCSYGQKSKPVANSEVEINNQNTATDNIDNILKRQILLTNAAQFTNARTLEGASGFLIKYNGANSQLRLGIY